MKGESELVQVLRSLLSDGRGWGREGVGTGLRIFLHYNLGQMFSLSRGVSALVGAEALVKV